MNTLPISSPRIDPYMLATMQWGNIKRFQGLHINCGEGTDTISNGWIPYDRAHHPNPPPLNQRFRRAIFEDSFNAYFWNERINYLNLMYYFLGHVSQAIVIVSLEQTTTQTIIEQCLKSKFEHVKRIAEGAVLVEKVDGWARRDCGK